MRLGNLISQSQNHKSRMEMRAANSTHFHSEFIILALLIMLLKTSVAFGQEENAVGVVTAVEGHAKIQSGGVFDVKEGMSILPGSKIQTSLGGKVKISFEDESSISIGEDSQFDLNEYGYQGHVELKLWRGAVDLSVQKKYDGVRITFQIETPSAAMSVRGTEFTVRFDDTNNETAVYVSSGEVEVGKKLEGFKIPDSARVKGGFEGRYTKGESKLTVAKLDLGKLRSYRDRIRPRAGAKHQDVFHKWKEKHLAFMNKRAKEQTQVAQASPPAPVPPGQALTAEPVVAPTAEVAPTGPIRVQAEEVPPPPRPKKKIDKPKKPAKQLKSKAKKKR